MNYSCPKSGTCGAAETVTPSFLPSCRDWQVLYFLPGSESSEINIYFDAESLNAENWYSEEN